MRNLKTHAAHAAALALALAYFAVWAGLASGRISPAVVPWLVWFTAGAMIAAPIVGHWIGATRATRASSADRRGQGEGVR